MVAFRHPVPIFSLDEFENWISCEFSLYTNAEKAIFPAGCMLLDSALLTAGSHQIWEFVFVSLIVYVFA